MLISGHKTRSVFDRYDICDERDIQLAGQKLAVYLEGQAKVRAKVRAVDAQNGPCEGPGNGSNTLLLQ